MGRTDQYCPCCGYDNFFPGNTRKYQDLLYTFNGLMETCGNCGFVYVYNTGNRNKKIEDYRNYLENLCPINTMNL